MPKDDYSRIEKILALILIGPLKGNKKEQAHQLNLAGFSNIEIADLIETTTGSVAQSLYERKKKGVKKKR